jgi:branched-chain amino acid transport system substrate-binding protein
MLQRSGVMILILTLLVVMGGCASPTPTEVAIGAVYPLSGSQAATGADIQHGLEFAAEIVNGEYDLSLPLAREAGLPKLGGAKIKLVLADHAGNADQGAAEAKRLIEQEKVVALIGAYNSSVTTQASQAAEAAEVPFLNPESTAADLTQRGFRWFFRTTADDTIFVQNFGNFLADLKAKHGIAPATVAVVYENSQFGTGVGQLEIGQAPQAGLTVVANVPYSSKATSVEQEVAQIKNSNATLLMQTSYEQDAILFMQTYKAQGYRPEAILAMDAGFISPAFVKTLGDDANYVLSRDVWAADLGKVKPLIQQVNDLYRQKYGVDLTGNSARAFTGLIVLADAINRAGSTEADKIRQALLATNIPAEQVIMPWDGVKFDPATGQNVLAKGIIVQIQEQAYRTVWPWDLANAELVWPMPAWGD